MPDPAEPLKSKSRIVAFERCEVWFWDDKVIIDAEVPLTDFKLREFGRPRMLFEGACYYVSEKSESSDHPRTYRYVLSPWPKSDESVTRSINLNDAYFRDLAEDRQRARRESVAFKVLAPFYPFLGFLWSPQKRTLNQVGFESHAISSLSIYVGFLIGFVCGVFLVVLSFGAGLFPGTLFVGMVAFTIDAVARFNRFLGGKDPIPPGFYEWLLRPKDTYE
jgi:hypothetical protein